jgi:hypothetical protein
MKHAHGMSSHNRGTYVVLVLLTIFLLPTFVLNGAFSGGVTLVTDKASYTVGETIFFSGLGYYPSGSKYEINVSYSGSVVASVGFASNETGGIPSDASWAIPFGTKNGTYSAGVFNVTDRLDANTFGMLLASTTFGVLNTTEALKALEGNLTDLKGLVTLNVTKMGINFSLIASLNNSIRKIEAAITLLGNGENKTAANQLRAARNMLTAFVHKVLAQSGKNIDNVTARALIGNASVCIEYIDSLIVTAELPLGKKMALNVQRTLAKQERHLTKFIISRDLNGYNTDEENMAWINFTEGEMAGILARVGARNKDMMGLWDNGSIDYQTLIMELAKDNDTVGSVEEGAQLLLAKFEELNMTKPSLGNHLGQFMKVAKELVNGSAETEKDIGGQMSSAKSQVHGGEHHGHGGEGHGGNGNKGGNSKKG